MSHSYRQWLLRWIFTENMLIHFYINSTRVIRQIKWNKTNQMKLIFPRIAISKPLSIPVHSACLIDQTQFRNQCKLLPQITSLIIYRVDGSITSMDIDNIIDNTDNIREMINAQQKNRKNRTLTSIKRALVLSKVYN